MGFADKAAYNEHMRQYMLDRYYARRADAIEHLGGVCVRCGSVEDLHFDHVDPATKTAEIAKIMLRRLDRLYEELAKCQLLCQSCHIAKTAEDAASGMSTRRSTKIDDPQHGTWAMYAKKKCRCGKCRTWRKMYRAKKVHADGSPRVAVSA